MKNCLPCLTKGLYRCHYGMLVFCEGQKFWQILTDVRRWAVGMGWLPLGENIGWYWVGFLSIYTLILNTFICVNGFSQSVSGCNIDDIAKQGVIFFMTSWGYAFFTKNFLWKKMTFYSTALNWMLKNTFYIVF